MKIKLINKIFIAVTAIFVISLLFSFAQTKETNGHLSEWISTANKFNHDLHYRDPFGGGDTQVQHLFNNATDTILTSYEHFSNADSYHINISGSVVIEASVSVVNATVRADIEIDLVQFEDGIYVQEIQASFINPIDNDVIFSAVKVIYNPETETFHRAKVDVKGQEYKKYTKYDTNSFIKNYGEIRYINPYIITRNNIRTEEDFFVQSNQHTGEATQYFAVANFRPSETARNLTDTIRTVVSQAESASLKSIGINNVNLGFMVDREGILKQITSRERFNISMSATGLNITGTGTTNLVHKFNDIGQPITSYEKPVIKE